MNGNVEILVVASCTVANLVLFVLFVAVCTTAISNVCNRRAPGGKPARCGQMADDDVEESVREATVIADDAEVHVGAVDARAEHCARIATRIVSAESSARQRPMDPDV
jgi:hypothetical protein